MNTPTPAPKGSFWQTVRAVGWSFVGIRKNSGYRDDLAKLNPLHIIAVAFVAVVLFVTALFLLVHWVAT
jgi:Protein of unknown function (DUF2970)